MRFPASVIAGVVLAVSPLQAAQPLDLSWQAPAGCPQESAVREQIRALVPASMLESGNLRAEGTITRIDKRFRLKLVLTFGNVRGERVIDSDSCGDLAGAAAVALGLLLQSATQSSSVDPNASTGTNPGTAGATSNADTGATPAGSSTPAPTASAEPRPPEAPPRADTQAASAPKSSEPQQPRRWRTFLQAPQLALGLGPLPDPTIGIAFALGFSVRPWLFGVGVQFPREQRLSLPGPSGAGASLKYWSAEAWACRAWRSSNLEIAPCLTFGVERLSATGTGSGVSPLSERATWVSFGAAAQGRWYVAEWFALAASAGARVEGARPTISVDGLPERGRLKPAAFTLQTGPVWIF